MSGAQGGRIWGGRAASRAGPGACGAAQQRRQAPLAQRGQGPLGPPVPAIIPYGVFTKAHRLNPCHFCGARRRSGERGSRRRRGWRHHRRCPPPAPPRRRASPRNIPSAPPAAAPEGTPPRAPAWAGREQHGRSVAALAAVHSRGRATPRAPQLRPTSPRPAHPRHIHCHCCDLALARRVHIQLDSRVGQMPVLHRQRVHPFRHACKRKGAAWQREGHQAAAAVQRQPHLHVC